MTGDRRGRPFMLLGHHRSGTNFLTDVLQAHPEVSMVDEPLSVHTRGFRDTDLLVWGADQWDDVRVHDALVDHPMSRARFQRLREFVTAPGEVVRGFKETILFEKMPWLHAAVPGLRTVLVVRDPRAVVGSLLKHDVDAIWEYSRALERYVGQPGAHRELVATGSPLARSVSSWRVRHRELLGAPPPGLRVFRLEDLVRDDSDVLAEMMRHIGLEPHEAQHRTMKEHQREHRGGMYSTYRTLDQVLNEWRRTLRPDEVAYVEERCAPEMELLGYDR